MHFGGPGQWYFNSKAEIANAWKEKDKTPRMNQQGPPFFIQNERNRDVEKVGGGERSSRNSPKRLPWSRENESSHRCSSGNRPLSHLPSPTVEGKKKKKNMQEVHVIHRDIRDSLDSVRGKMRV